MRLKFLCLALFAALAAPAFAQASQGYLFPMASSSSDGYLSASSFSTFSAAAPAASPAFSGNVSDANGHLIVTQTTPPVATVGVAAGTGATCALAHATDTAGQVTISTGSSGTSSGALCTVAFHTAYGVAPICQLSPAGSTVVSGVYVGSATANVTVNDGATAPTGATIVENYSCVQTQ